MKGEPTKIAKRTSELKIFNKNGKRNHFPSPQKRYCIYFAILPKVLPHWKYQDFDSGLTSQQASGIVRALKSVDKYVEEVMLLSHGVSHTAPCLRFILRRSLEKRAVIKDSLTYTVIITAQTNADLKNATKNLEHDQSCSVIADPILFKH